MKKKNQYETLKKNMATVLIDVLINMIWCAFYVVSAQSDNISDQSQTVPFS